MNATQIRAAADRLLGCWRAGRAIPALPEAERPATRAEGYAIQAELQRASGSKLFGWKIAATSAAGQAHIGVDGPMAGRLFADRVVESGATIPLGGNRMRVAEAEFAFRMDRTLPPRATPYTLDEVLDAVASLHPAIEIPDSRYEDFVHAGGPQLIADNACAHLFVLGPATAADWRALDLAAHPVVGTVTGAPPAHGRGANALGDPRVALAWLANELRGLGIPLAAGEVVTTGTCVTPMPIGAGCEAAIDLGPVGTAAVLIAA